MMANTFTNSSFKALIRRAVSNDIERIVNLMNQGAPEGGKNQSPTNLILNDYYAAFQKIEKDPNQYLMVAEINKEVIGTFQMSFLSYLSGAGQEDCQIENVFIAPEWRAKGVGTQMMNWAINHAKNSNCRRIQLTSNKKRKDAHRFYERLGFQSSHDGFKLQL